MSGAYEPFDQAEHLGDPPWSRTDSALLAWEAGHGHDVRLKCYPEFGCQAGGDPDVLRDERDQARADLAAAHTREAALRAAVERVIDSCGVTARDILRRALDGTDQQPGDAT